MTDPRALVELRDCPPGPFLFDGALGFKTEYGKMETIGPVDVPGDQIRWTVGRYPDAYCLDSGEVFWGGAKTHEDRARLLVEPMPDLSEAAATITRLEAENERLRAVVQSDADRWFGYRDAKGVTLGAEFYDAHDCDNIGRALLGALHRMKALPALDPSGDAMGGRGG